MRSHEYGSDVLAAGGRPRRRPVPPVEAAPGLVVEDAEGRFCGAVVGCDKAAVTLEDRHGRRRVFPLTPAAFLFEGRPVTLVRPASAAPVVPSVPARTASGSVAAPSPRARVARASRIYVEGRHDAELVEKIWGDDLREVGVVVEYLEGVDRLPEIMAEFGPGPGRRLGVLVDHLVPGSKESRIRPPARAARRSGPQHGQRGGSGPHHGQRGGSGRQLHGQRGGSGPQHGQRGGPGRQLRGQRGGLRASPSPPRELLTAR